MINIIQKLL